MSLYLTTIKNNFSRQTDNVCSQGGKALVLILGATSGAQEGFSALEVLRANNMSLIPVASAGALKLYGVENLQSLGGFSLVHAETAFDNIDIVKSVELIYLPVITANLAGKLANGIYDEFLAVLIFHAQMAGIPIIGTVDGASPDGEDFRRRGYNNPSAGFAAMLNSNLAKIAAQDIKLYPAGEVANRLKKLLGSQSKVQAAEAKNNEQQSIKKKFITLSDLQGKGNTVLELVPGAVITDLAKEYAEKSNISFK